MSFWADAASAVFSGGATGILGAGLQVVGQYFKDRQKNKHELEVRKLDMESMKMEAELNLQKSQQEAAAAMAIAEQHSFEKSFETDKASYSDPSKVDGWAQYALVFVDVVRGLIRPALTVWLCIVITKVYFQLMELTGGLKAFNEEYLFKTLDEVIYAIIYIGSTVILWWFGSRAQQALKPKR